MDRFEDLRVFVRVVEAGGISKAADQLNIAKSAVSRRIGDMEHRLAAQLFNRTTRKMSLTETGQAFYDRAQRILDDLEEAEAEVAEQQSALKGRIKVAMPLNFGLTHMTPLIKRFMLDWPEVTFDIDLNDRKVDIIEEGFDLAIRIGRLADSALLARRLGPVNGVTTASPAFLEKHGVPQHPGELENLPCLCYRNLKDPTRWEFSDKQGKTIVCRVEERLSASDGRFLKEAAIDGLGIVRQPTFISWDAIQSGQLVPILCDWDGSIGDIYAVYPPTRRLSRRVRVFIDYLAEHIGDCPHWDDIYRERLP